MNNNLVVAKASGITEPFSILKLRKSLAKAKANPESIDVIIEMLLLKLYQGISIKKIYSEAFHTLRSHSKHCSARYDLKKGMMELGASGYLFDQYTGGLFKHQGFAVEI